MFPRIVATERDVVDLADVHEPSAAGVADGALHILFHLQQGVGQRAFDRFQNARTFDVFVLAFIEVAGGAVVFLEPLAIDFHRLTGTFLVTRQHRANHHHGGAKADRFGDVAVLVDAAVGNDRFGCHAGTPLDGAELPAAGAKTGLEFGDADLAWANTDLGRVGTPVFQINYGFGR